MKICQKEYSVIADLKEIIKYAKMSFVNNGKNKYDILEATLSLCKQIDKYFEKEGKNKRILRIGETKSYDTTVLMFYDEEYFYIKSEDLRKTILGSEKGLKLSKDVKEVLVEKDLIKSHINSNGKTEYSVHIQKKLSDGQKMTHRYFAFKREALKKDGLFLCVENYIASKENKEENI